MNWKLNSNLTAMSIVAAILILAGGTVVGAYHSFKYLGWIAVFPVAGFLFADYMGAHLIFFAHKEQGLLGWSALACKFLIFGTLLLNGASLVYLLITESKDSAREASKIEAEKSKVEIETAAKMKLIEAESAARRAEETQRAENAAKLLAATGNARLARVVTTTRPTMFDVVPTPSPSPTPGPASGATEEDNPSTFERFIKWYTRAPLYFSGGLVGLMCFVLTQTFGKLASDRKAQTATEWPDEIEVKTRTRRADFSLVPAKNAHRSSSVLGRDAAKGKTRGDQMTGLEALRATLSDISFYHPGISFKADLKPDHPREPDHVRIRAMLAREGTQETIASTKAALSILDDALTMERSAFRERLESFLKKRGFEL